MPANISVSSLCTVIARYDSGSGRAAKSSGVESGDWIASRMSLTVTVMPPANGVLREDAEGYVGAAEGWLRRAVGSADGAVRQRGVAREAACDAGVRAGRPRFAGTAGVRMASARRPPGQLQGMTPRVTSQG